MNMPISDARQAAARRIRYEAALRRLDVAHNPRYQPNREGQGETYCNLFVADATAMMGVPIPLFIPEGGGRRRWLDVAGMLGWLQQHADRWHTVPVEAAQRLANRGYPVVAIWENPGGAGHMAMVRPGPLPVPARGPRIAQAGLRNLPNTDAAEGFGGEARLAQITYFAPAGVI